MMKMLGWAMAGILASAAPAWAQACGNCGGYHGGAPSSGKMQAAADQKSSEIDAMMKRFEQKAQALKQEYQTAAKERISEIQAEQQASQAAIAASKREEILNRKGAEAMKKLEEAQKQGAPALGAQERAAALGQMKTLMGTEAARERMKLRDTNAALEQLKRKESNDRPAPKSIEQVPSGAIFNALVTPFEQAKQRISNIFDNADFVDPTKE